jgi:phosphopantothenate-cysteine ligase
MQKIIITSGGTSEAIDNVRKITNSSTGKLGATIANVIINKKDEEIEKIYYICSKTSIKPTANNKIKIIEIVSANDLKNVMENLLTTEQIDCVIHGMAVSDYTVDYVTTSNCLTKSIKNIIDNLNDIEKMNDGMRNNTSIIDNNNKISSSESDLIIKLKPTPKIISLIKELSPKSYLVGFKLLDNVSEDELIKVATNIMVKNKCNLVVANDLTNIRNGEHKAIIIDENNRITRSEGKEDIALKLVEKIWVN